MFRLCQSPLGPIFPSLNLLKGSAVIIFLLRPPHLPAFSAALAYSRSTIRGTVEEFFQSALLETTRREGNRHGHLLGLSPIPAALQVSFHELIMR